MSQKKYVTIGFDASREPLDELFWVEAVIEGSWTTITTCDRLRSRREIVERVSELDSALIGVDFACSFPLGFLEYVASQKVATTHKELSKKIRQDLKKNTDDGIRIWIELMAAYRESNVETSDQTRARIFRGNQHPDNRRRPEIPIVERRTLVERFRRVERILRRQQPEALATTLGIRYNKLTARYEYTESNARGRAAIVGIALLEQLREVKPNIAIWPFDKPAAITVTEVFSKMFDEKIRLSNDALREYFDSEEDNALHIPKEVRDQVYAHPKAREAVFTLLGMLSAERREDKSLRPIRDYRDGFYENPEIQLEGWAYGIGYKEFRPDVKKTVTIEAPPESVSVTEVTEPIIATTPQE